MEEVWKDVQGYEGLYKISSKGRVYGLARKMMLHPEKSGGYLRITFTVDKQKKKFLVHRLVADAFIDNPNHYSQVNHIDENKENNCVENLEWCTPSYNINYGARNDKVSEKAKPVYQMSMDGKIIALHRSVMEASKNLGMDFSTIYRCCRGGLDHAYGYIWKYAE